MPPSPAGLPATAAGAERELLRFFTCGSVDDGKSTLIGRLLHEAEAIFQDQFSALRSDSRRFGTTGEEVDLALLLDGLEAEREQGITIDVAYRFFSTPRRAFIAIDTPGHEQYTRNMATGASNADVAIVLVDARKGILPQTKRHSVIASLLGVQHIVLAVNKIDLAGYEAERFGQIVADFDAFARGLSFRSVTAIPLSARFGDNVTGPSSATPWYQGPSLTEFLETVEVRSSLDDVPFRFPVQWVNRPHDGFRGLSGTVVSGRVRKGAELVASGSGRLSRVERIVTFDGDRAEATAGDAVTIVLAEEIDASRGEVLADPKDRPDISSRFEARLVWMTDRPLRRGDTFLLKLGFRTVPATITAVRHRLDTETLETSDADQLGLNDVGDVEIETAVPVAFDPYHVNRFTGAFILIDRASNASAGAGMVSGPVAASHVHTYSFDLDRAAHARLKHQRPLVIWFTGLPGAGKSTIANLVERKLFGRGRHTALLDGDRLRQGLNADLGFDEASRTENIRRAAEVARLMIDAGLIVLCAFVSPFRRDRERVRAYFGEGEFIEVFVDTPLEICSARDPKGHYARARSGGIASFTGIGQGYEAPENPELVLKAGELDADTLAEAVVGYVERRIAEVS